MRRNLFFAIVILLLALGIVWLFFCGTRGCDVSLIKGSTTTHQKPMDNIALSVSGKDRCIGSALLSTFQRILYDAMNSEIDTCVVLFHAEVFLSDDVLQNELQTLLVQLYPDEMPSALKSSGNVHNPKLSFLYTVLKQAIRDTPSMQELSRIAHSYGYDAIIQSLGGEKLQLKRSDLTGKQFVDPSTRIYGIWGFSARKSGWENKADLKARIVDVDAKGNILTDDIKVVDKRQYW